MHNEATSTVVNAAINADVKRFILMSANTASPYRCFRISNFKMAGRGGGDNLPA